MQDAKARTHARHKQASMRLKAHKTCTLKAHTNDVMAERYVGILILNVHVHDASILQIT